MKDTSTTPTTPQATGSAQAIAAGAALALLLCAAPRAMAQLGLGGQTIGGPGIVDLKAPKQADDEGMATVLVSEKPLAACATVRPLKGTVSGIYLGAGDQEGHFDIGPTGDVISRTASVCGANVAWVSVHCRGACSFEWRVDQLR